MTNEKEPNQTWNVLRRHTSVQWRMVKHRSELSIPIEGDWMTEWGFTIGTPVRIMVRPERMSIHTLK
ncbi:MAG: SymE family type I addiction module toxin [Janthinobacterium lividum]